MTRRSREYLCGGVGTLNTEQRKSECDTRFTRHPKCHASTGTAQSHHTSYHGSAAADSTTLAQTQPQDLAFTQNMASILRLCKHSRNDPSPPATDTQMHAKTVSWPRGRPKPTYLTSISSAGPPSSDHRDTAASDLPSR